MTVFLEVVVPGPWWHTLTYEFDITVDRGIRLLVPVGRGTRTGFATGISTSSPPRSPFRILKAGKVIDSSPPLGWELFETASRLGTYFLCGFGEALGIVSPRHVLSGEHTGDLPVVEKPSAQFIEDACYQPCLNDRMEMYREAIKPEIGGALVIFPEREGARLFWKQLDKGLRDQSLLWLSNSGVKARDNWERVRRGEIRLVIGSPAAVFAPFPSLRCVIVEDEGNPAYHSQRFPFINTRSAAGVRARLWGARFLIGGSVPSSRSFLRNPRQCSLNLSKRMVFVSLGDCRKISIPGVQLPAPVSDTVLTRTQNLVSDKRAVIWILDRKGYSSSIICNECGRVLACENCGLPQRWEDGKGVFRCGFCGSVRPVSDVCPYCGGIALEGRKPGIESLKVIADCLTGRDIPVKQWHAGIEKSVSEKKRIAKDLALGGLVIGSRKALELCDVLPVSLICWLDADAAANNPFYDSRTRAFRMVWESAWRGPGGRERTIVVQSRVPRSGWQKGLTLGWDHFWKEELEERKQMDLPPWKYLVEIKDLGKQKEQAKASFKEVGVECLDPGISEDTIWLKSDNLSKVRKIMEPFFSITGSNRGFPKIALWAD